MIHYENITTNKHNLTVEHFFLFYFQWNRWSTGAMSRSRASCSAPASRSWSPCRCSRSSASSRTSRCWSCSVRCRSGSTKMCCRQCKRRPRATPSSEFFQLSLVFFGIDFHGLIRFREYLDFDLTLSQEKVQQLTTVAVAHFNALLSELRRLFLVEDLVDSIKFGVVLYCLTYVGAIFNGMTCVIIGEFDFSVNRFRSSFKILCLLF